MAVEYVCIPACFHGDTVDLLPVSGRVAAVGPPLSPLRHCGSPLGGVVGGVAGGKVVHDEREGVGLTGWYLGRWAEEVPATQVCAGTRW